MRSRRRRRSGACLTLFFAIDPEGLLNLAFGPEYGRAADWLVPLAVAMTIYSLAYVYLFHFLAVGRTRYWLVAAPVLVGQAVLYGFMHDRPAQLIAVQMVSAVVLAVGERGVRPAAARVSVPDTDLRTTAA